MKKRTRFLALILAAALLVGSAPNAAAAIGRTLIAQQRTSETTYTSDQGWSLTFDSATGTVTAFDAGSFSGGEVQLPQSIETVPVTKIGENAFRDKRPASGTWTKLVLPEGITEIGISAFWTAQIKEIQLPETLQIIGENAFRGSWVGKMTVPAGVTEIGNYAWYDSGLKEVTLLCQNAQLGSTLFGHCQLGDFAVPEWMTDIGTVFRECNMTGITLAEGTTAIGETAFENCYQLQSVKNMDGVTGIAANAFSNCYKLTDVDLSSLTTLGESAFYNCDRLSRIVLPETLTEIPKGAFQSTNALSSVTLPDTLRTIGESAFEECSGLTGLTLPEGLTTLGKRAFAESGLTSISIPAGVTALADEIFDSASRLGSVTLPDTLEQIGTKAFYNTGLTEISIPSNVRTIGDQAFSNCRALSSITLQENLTTLGAYVFENTYALTQISLPDTVTDIGAYAFWQSGVTAITIPAAMTEIGDDAFAVSNIQEVTFHDGVTRIGSGAFNESELTSITFPQNLQSVGTRAFSRTPITTVTIPAGVTFDEGYSWSDGAFYGCESLTSADVATGVTRLSAFLFSNCKALKDVSLPEGLTELGTAAFYDCDALTEITLPDSLQTIGNAAFSQCNFLTALTLPQNLERIETNAFQWSGIQEITLPPSVTYVGYQAFCCSDLDAVYVYGRTTEFDRYAFLRDDGSMFNMWGNPDLVIHAYEGSTAAEYMLKYGDANRLVYLLEVAETRTLSASVVDESGTSVTEGYTIGWYQEGEDGETPVGTGAVLTGALTDCAYLCEIVLDDTLLEQYVQPERQRIDAGTTDATLTFTLEKIPTVTVTGRILDRDGNAIAGASVSAGQNCATQSGADGSFVLPEVSVDGAIVSVGKDGYYSKTVPVFIMDTMETDTIDLGDIVLYKAVEDRLLLTLTVRHATGEGETPWTETLSSIGGLDVTLTSNGSEISSSLYEIQGSTILFQPDTVAAGQQISVTVSDPSGCLLEGQAAVTLNANKMGSVSLTLQEKGAFTLDEITLAGQSNVLVFDETGGYVATYSAQAGVTSQPMDGGSYTLVFMENTSLLRHVADLSVLNQLGLQDGTDYVSRPITIADGILTLVSGVTVPDLSEDAFSYLESGGVFASTATAAQGTLVLITVQMDLSAGYRANQIQIYLTDNMSLLNGSVTLDNKVSTYTLTDGMLTVPVSDKETATLRFYLTANDTGSAAVEAYANLTNGALQPIGSVSIRNVQVEMDLPSITACETIIVTGKTIPDSTVRIYDNGTLVGETTANAVGSWSSSVTLAGPLYNDSYHTIHAEVTYQGNLPIRTGEALVTYDERAANLKTITMYSQNHITGETATVLDFTRIQTVKPYYYYWPDHMNYTFKVEFTKNARQLTDVTVVVTGANGETILIPAVYDENTDAWLAAYEFNSQNMPVSVGAEYTMEETDRQYSLQKIMDAAQQTEALVEQVADSYDVVYIDDAEEAVVDDSTLIYEFDIDQADIENGVLPIELTNADGEVICRYTLQDAEDTRTAAELEQDGFGTRDQNLYIKFTLEETGMQYEYVDLTEQSRVIERYEFGGGSPAAAARMLGLTEAMSVDFTNSSWLTYEQIASQIIGALSLAPIFGQFASATQEIIETSGEQLVWRNELEGNYEALQNMLETARKLLDATCPDGSRRLPAEWYNRLKDVYDALAEEIEQYRLNGHLMLNSAITLPLLESAITDGIAKFIANKTPQIKEKFNRIINDAVKDSLDDATKKAYSEKIIEFLNKKHTYGEHISNQEFTLGGILKDAGIAVPDYEGTIKLIEQIIAERFYTTSPDGNVIDVGFMGFTVKFYTEQGINNYINSGYEEYNYRLLDLLKAIRQKYQMCQTDEEKEIEHSDDAQDRDLDPIYDPSGYVYEAVPSNRLEGVTATVYYKTDSTEESVWDAEAYDQQNPQVTGADGTFAWFVPDGNWQVRFTKDGYLDADSSGVPAATANGANEGWLPVPPPQFEVNVAMVSEKAPEVENVTAYTDRIEVVFSQYMNIESVQDAITLRDAAILITPLDAEYDLEQENQYATRFSVVPEDGLYEGTLTIAASAKNYAGTALSEDSSITVSGPVQRPVGIMVEGNPAVVIHQNAQLTLKLEPGMEGQELTIENLTPSLLGVSGQSVTTGPDGTATITLTGILPGTGQLCVTEPVSGLSRTISVQIVMTESDLPNEPEPEKPQSVTAALSDGTPVISGMEVASGTQITLATATQDAVIRYTLNGTCPCTEEALVYSKPIAITNDTVLRAAACKDGVYSDTIRLELSVKEETTEQPDGSFNGGSISSVKDEPELLLPFTDVPKGAWFYDAVRYVYEEGLMVGTSATAFGPDVATSRGMIATILWRMEGCPAAAGESGFTDVGAGMWYTDAIAWAAAEGIVNGCGDGTFKPDDAVTREQMAVMLYRYARYKGYDVTAGEDTNIMSYRDFAALDEYAISAMQWACGIGIINGTNDGSTLSPDGQATRGQIAVMLQRFFGT